MTTQTLFISDLHLDIQRPDILALFFKFIQEQAPLADSLYILGDLFEAWIGDDDDAEICQTVKAALKPLTEKIPVFVMHGNRDFLLGKQFEQDTGCQLLPEQHTLDVYGVSTLLMHGDTLCTDDVAYLQLRQTLHHPLWQQDFLSKNLDERRLMAQQLRQQSQAAMQSKSEEIMDANPQAVETAFQQHKVQRIIHGHTHRPQIHTTDVAGTRVERVVLGDWYQQGSILVCDAQGCHLSVYE